MAFKKTKRFFKSLLPGGETPSEAIASFKEEPTPEQPRPSTGAEAQKLVQAIDRTAREPPTDVKREPGIIGPGQTGGPERQIHSALQNEEATRSIVDIAKTILFGTGAPEGGIIDPFTGKVLTDPATGEPAQISLGYAPAIGFVGGSGGIRAPDVVKGVGIFQKVKNLVTWKNAFKLGSSIAGVDLLAVWLGADNRVSTSSFYSNLVKDGYNNGEKTQAEALARMDELDRTREEATSFINISTILNPLLWAFRPMFMGNSEDARLNMEVNRNFIETVPETKSAMFERTREESQQQFLENQKMLNDSKEAANEAFARAERERNANAKAWAKEQAQFYEAIRKRNAGEPLTQEEIDLLWSWGVNPTLSFADWDAYGQSNLNFGLI